MVFLPLFYWPRRGVWCCYGFAPLPFAWLNTPTHRAQALCAGFYSGLASSFLAVISSVYRVVSGKARLRFQN